MAQVVVRRQNVLVSGFEGYGAQLNQNVAAKITRDTGVTARHLADLPGHVEALAPHFVRIFFSGDAFLDTPTGHDGDLMRSFHQTVDLAQRVASTINLTFQTIGPKVYTDRMPQFAELLHDLITNRGITKLKWVTIRNEPNGSPAIPKQLYLELHRQLDKRLRQLGVRSKLGLMGGDLVERPTSAEQNQKPWFEFLATQLVPAKLLDAYSVHVYWNYDETPKIQRRLQGVRDIWTGLPADARKPLYVTEYGVRGRRKVNGKKLPEPGLFGDGGPPIVGTTINAFQHAWFNLFAAKLGYHGLAKWDAYFGKYDSGKQEYGMIGRPGAQGWQLRPSYELTRLFTHTVKPGWDVVAVDAAAGDELVAGYAGGAGQLTVIGLDRRGGSLSSPSPTIVPYHLGGLPRNASLHLLYWNRHGGGLTTDAGEVRTNSSGELTVEAPLHSVFALTTLPGPF